MQNNIYFSSNYDVPRALGHVRLCDFDLSIIRLPYMAIFKIINYDYFIKHAKITIGGALTTYAREWYIDAFKFAAYLANIAEQKMKINNVDKIWNICLLKASETCQINKEIERFGVAILCEHWIYGNILYEHWVYENIKDISSLNKLKSTWYPSNILK